MVAWFSMLMLLSRSCSSGWWWCLFQRAWGCRCSDWGEQDPGGCGVKTVGASLRWEPRMTGCRAFALFCSAAGGPRGDAEDQHAAGEHVFTPESRSTAARSLAVLCCWLSWVSPRTWAADRQQSRYFNQSWALWALKSFSKLPLRQTLHLLPAHSSSLWLPLYNSVGVVVTGKKESTEGGLARSPEEHRCSVSGWRTGAPSPTDLTKEVNVHFSTF